MLCCTFHKLEDERTGFMLGPQCQNKKLDSGAREKSDARSGKSGPVRK